jgi:hypothetical protein
MESLMPNKLTKDSPAVRLFAAVFDRRNPIDYENVASYVNENGEAKNDAEKLAAEHEYLCSKRLEVELLKLRDPSTVCLNMLSGAIARPSLDQILHLYPEIRGLISSARKEQRIIDLKEIEVMIGSLAETTFDSEPEFSCTLHIEEMVHKLLVTTQIDIVTEEHQWRE